MALKAAVEKVVEEHMRDGQPLYIWLDGKVIEVSAQELREQSTRAVSITALCRIARGVLGRTLQSLLPSSQM